MNLTNSLTILDNSFPFYRIQKTRFKIQFGLDFSHNLVPDRSNDLGTNYQRRPTFPDRSNDQGTISYPVFLFFSVASTVPTVHQRSAYDDHRSLVVPTSRERSLAQKTWLICSSHRFNEVPTKSNDCQRMGRTLERSVGRSNGLTARNLTFLHLGLDLRKSRTILKPNSVFSPTMVAPTPSVAYVSSPWEESNLP
jgi:hypothetical protein